MLKKITYTCFAVAIAVVLVNAEVKFHTKPPTGLTGANGAAYCTNCHSSFALNSGGGSVAVSGLPSAGYTAGTPYNFSVTIKHGTADRRRWGFSIKAVNSSGQSIGTFSSTNAHAGPNSDELSHLYAELLTTPTDSFTYNNLTWTAPASPATADASVTFYYVGNATNGSNTPDGDYVYSASTMVTLPLTLTDFTAKAVNGTSIQLNWITSSESNSSHFIIEKSSDNQHFIQVATIDAAGTSTGLKHYSFADEKPAYFETPTFYRLVSIDKDGTKKYSKIVNVTLKAKGSFVRKLYPNPIVAGNIMQAEIISDKSQAVTIQLFSFTGSRIKDIKTTIVKGNNLVNIPIHKFTASGMYTLMLKTDGQTQQIPLLIR